MGLEGYLKPPQGDPPSSPCFSTSQGRGQGHALRGAQDLGLLNSLWGAVQEGFSEHLGGSGCPCGEGRCPLRLGGGSRLQLGAAAGSAAGAPLPPRRMLSPTSGFLLSFLFPLSPCHISLSRPPPPAPGSVTEAVGWRWHGDGPLLPAARQQSGAERIPLGTLSASPCSGTCHGETSRASSRASSGAGSSRCHGEQFCVQGAALRGPSPGSSVVPAGSSAH